MANSDEVIEQIKNETNFFTKAKLLQHLVKEKQTRIKDISKKLGVKESYICHILRLNKLSEMVVDGYYSELISISHLFVISRLKNQEDMVKVYEKVLANSLTVFQTEELVRELLYKVNAKGTQLPKEEIDFLQKRLAEKDNKMKVKIMQTRIKSKIIIEIKGSLVETTPKLKEICAKLNPAEKITFVEEVSS